MKPTIRAYVIGPQDTDLDVFYTLPMAIGAKRHFERAHLRLRKHVIELLPDVHRDHRVGNAILVVPSRGIDRYLRIAIANAWREGVRRLILLFAGYKLPSAADVQGIEQELRLLLRSFGDGSLGSAPSLCASLTRGAGRVEGNMRDTMKQLAELIEHAFPPNDTFVGNEPLPSGFERELEILDVVRPLTRAGTLGRPLQDATSEVDANAPRCVRCAQPTRALFRVDMRDALHPTPSAHHVFVTYQCRDCPSYSTDIHVVHIEPLQHAPAMKAEALCYMLPHGEWLSSTHPDAFERLATIDEDPERLYYDAQDALGMGAVCIPNHLGGWGMGWAPRDGCPKCDKEPVLVASLQRGDGWNDLWACPDHPSFAQCNFHK
jgi:hypothetical protein